MSVRRHTARTARIPLADRLRQAAQGADARRGTHRPVPPPPPAVTPASLEDENHDIPPDTPDLSEQEALARELEAVETALCQKSLRAFLEKVWPIVEPVKDFVPNWHIDVLCETLERVTRGEITRLLVNVPPGTMKSLLISVIWPAWEWMSQPELRYLTASYSGHLTVRDNLKVRAILQSEWYRAATGLVLVDDQNQKTLFKNEDGGWRIASSVNGPATGEHPDRIIIDDPLTAEQARSAAERGSANDWFDSTISTRGVARDTVIVVVAQRLHEDDLPGHLIARGGWFHICWPMRYETTRVNQPNWKPDPLDQRTKPGELLWPTLFTEAKVRQLELDLGPYGTAGQLQQSPAPEGGGLFKREWFKYVDAAPAIKRTARGWDTAATEGAGDYTAGVKISEACGPVTDETEGTVSMQGLGVFYVEDCICDQVSPAGGDALIKQTAIADGKACVQREEKEGGASGKIVVAARLKLLKGYDYKGTEITGDKVTRSKPFRAQVEGGNVFLVRGPWNEAYITELCNFPTGTHDDRVDASSCAFNAVLLEPPPQEDYITW
jgi:predicted phage terminase large subunit-like protein